MKITSRFDKVLKWLTVLAMTMSCFTDMPIRVVAESFDVDSVVSIESSTNGADASDSVNLTVSVTVNGQTVSAAKSVAPGTLTVRANDGYEIDSMDLDGTAFNDTIEVQETSQSLNISAHPTTTQVNEPEETEKTPEPTVTPETTPEVSEEPEVTETPEVTEPTENPNDIIEITNELIFNENKASANIRLGVLGNPSISMGDILYNEEELTLDDASIVMNELDSLRQVDFIATKNGTYTFKITLTDTSAQEYTEIGAKEVTVEVEGLTELQASENLNKDQPTTYARNEITLEIGATANLEGSGSWTSYNHKWNQRSNDGGSVTISNASSNTAKITGKKAGTVTITHTWNVNKSETFIINVVSAGQKSYDLYFYSLVPGKTIGSTGTPDSIWNGMGKGSLVGLNAPGTYANGVNLYDESLNITYPGNYPNINVAGKTYQYAAPGSGNETKEGYYTLEWIRLVRAEGANAGNNGYNPTVSTNTPTFHMDGQIFINEHNLYNVTFRMKMPGSDSFDIQEGYSILVPSGTSASTLSKPSTQDRTFDGDTYKFDGWYTDEACTQPANFNSKITENTNYYGKYVAEQKYTVTYVLNGGISSERLVYSDLRKNSNTPLINDPVRPGYVFAGWNPSVQEKVTADATYTAQWIEDEDITINYKATTGGNVDPTYETLSPATGKAQGSTATASAGYHFVNWTNASGDEVSTEAHFSPNKVGGLNVAATYTAHFEVDENQTKDLSYTVQHIVEGKVKDTFTETVTVQVLQPNTIARNEALEADQNYEGYVKVGTDPAEVPAQIENGAVIKVNYEVQSYNYKVSHIYRDAEDNVVEDLTTTSETRDYLSAISESPRPATSGNFVLTNVEVESQDQSTLTADKDGNVTGTMPAEDLTITFFYDADENHDEIPDKYQITVSYRAVNGTITANNGPFTLNKVDANGDYAVDGVAHLTVDQIATATANEGYHFVSWSPKAPTTEIELSEDTEFVANFAINEYTAIVNYIDEDTDEVIGTAKQVKVNHGETVNGADHVINIEDYVYTNADSKAITEDNMEVNVYYSADENHDEIPDKYQITISYRAVNGTITANNGPFTLNKVDANGDYAVDGAAHLTDEQIAKASPNNGYQGGTWSPMSPTTALDLTEDTTFTITFTATPTDPDEPNPGCPEGTVWDEAAQACLAPFVPGPEPFVPGPGPVNPGPEEEVIVEPETPEQGGTATPTPTPEIEEIEEPEQPEVGHKGSWALINLIASLLGLLAALFLIFAKHQKDDDEEDQNQSAAMNEEDPEQLKRKRIYKWISGLTAVVSIIVFVLTENMRLPMILVDKWTLLMVVFFLINAVTLYLGRRWHENEDDEEQTQA